MIVIYIGRCRCTWPLFFPLWIESNRDTTFVWITFHLITFPMCSSRLISSYIYISCLYSKEYASSIDRPVSVSTIVVRVSRHKWRSLESGHWLSGRHPTWHSQTHSFIHFPIIIVVQCRMKTSERAWHTIGCDHVRSTWSFWCCLIKCATSHNTTHTLTNTNQFTGNKTTTMMMMMMMKTLNKTLY